MANNTKIKSSEGKCRYRPNVLIGNWNEELLRQSCTKKFLTKRDRNELLIQHSREMFRIFLKEIALETPFPYIRFGARIHVCAVDMPRCRLYPDVSMVISLSLDSVNVRTEQTFNEKCDVVLGPAVSSYARNVFIIQSPDGVDRTGQTLKYNEDFQLKCIDDDETAGRAFVLFSSPKTSGLQNMSSYPVVSYKNGEVNQSVGVCLQNPPIKDGCLPKIPPAHCNWRCLHRLPNQRYESEGEPVPSNERIVIAHSSTNKLLAGEEVWVTNLFGKECGVSVTTYMSVQKIETYKNMWMLQAFDTNCGEATS